MKTVQMTLEEELLAEVDKAVARLGTSRSAFAREALRRALRVLHQRDMEDSHRRGYERFPVGTDEFSKWEDEQVWPD